jgi:2-iminoacetate synthase
LAEYLEDYAPLNLVDKGWEMVEKNIQKLDGVANVEEIRDRLIRIKKGERDLYF